MNRNKAHQALVARILRDVGASHDWMLMTNPNGMAKCVDKTGRIYTLKYGLGDGSADIIACAFGRFVGLEAKTGEGVLRDSQKDWAKAIRMRGGIAREVRSVEDARAALMEASP